MARQSSEPSRVITDSTAIALAQASIDMLQLDGASVAATTDASDSDLSTLDATLKFIGRLGVELPLQTNGSRTYPVMLGRFQVHEQVGRGGFGMVFRAHDPDLQRVVALKIPLPERLLADHSLEDCVREAQIAAQLEHPGIVRVYEAGRLGAIWYIASEYRKGPTLAQWLSERSSPPSSQLAAELMIQISDAVHYAHGRGVLHLDLKPANILVDSAPHDANAVRPMVTDFGLASRIDALPHGETQRIAGTIAYMSPEQLRGDASRIGVETDVFALGAILYDLLHPLANSMAHTSRKGSGSSPDAPQELRPPSDLIPRDLDAICQKCLEFDAGERYTSANALSIDLQRFLDGHPVVARPVVWHERLLYLARRRPIIMAVISILAVTILTCFVFIFCAWRLAKTTIAALQEEKLIHAETANRMDLSLLNLTWLMQENQLQPQPVSNDTRVELSILRDFYREITSWSNHISTGPSREALLAAGHSLAMLEDITTSDHHSLNENFLAGLAAWKAVVNKAPYESNWRRAIALHVLYYSQKSPIAGVMWWRHPEVAGPPMDKDAIQIIEEPFATLSIDLAKKLKRASDHERARLALKNAIVLLEERQHLPDPEHSRCADLLVAYNELAIVSQQIGTAIDFRRALEDSIALAEDMTGAAKNMPRLASAVGEAFNLYAIDSLRKRDSRAALASYCRAIEFTRLAGTADSEDVNLVIKLANLHERSAILYASLGEHRSAAAEYREALNELNEKISRNPSQSVLVYYRAAMSGALSQELLALEDHSAAESALHDAISDYENNPPSNQHTRKQWKDAIICYRMQAQLYAAQKRSVDGVDAFMKSQKLLEQAKARFGIHKDFKELESKNRREMAALNAQPAKSHHTIKPGKEKP
jgi:serine/threonine protein kinase/tetratricopeptide (TPR) repeat protein